MLNKRQRASRVLFSAAVVYTSSHKLCREEINRLSSSKAPILLAETGRASGVRVPGLHGAVRLSQKWPLYCIFHSYQLSNSCIHFELAKSPWSKHSHVFS
jgi:hypothetical protein